MPATYSFNFGDRRLDYGPWTVSFRVFTENNVYTPDPAGMQVVRRDGGLTSTAHRMAWAGGQQHVPARFEAVITPVADGFDCRIDADMHERIKGTCVYLHGRPRGELVDRDMAFKPVPAAGAVASYPNTILAPLFVIRHADGRHTAAASLDEAVVPKTLAIVPEDGAWTLELHHHVDARHWSTSVRTPVWRIIESADVQPLVQARRQIMERCWGLRRWEDRADVPPWARSIGLVLNLHGMHWTGFLFNDYDRQLRIIRHVCDRIDGRHVLAYLPAWDGRYNFNWPRYQADPRMGGDQGLARLVQGAHELGVRVIPQIGAVSANRAFLPPALHDCASQDSYGNAYVKPTDWDNDRAPDTYRVNANIGHPAFCRFLFDQTRRLRQTFGFDGIFLDINQTHHNDPRVSIVQGHLQFARWCREQFDDFLVFGEKWYDGILAAYPLCHSMVGPRDGALANYADLFDPYARTTYHLIHPAPGAGGRGSTGVYEHGYLEPFVPDPGIEAIPAISFVDDTLDRYADEVASRIEAARAYIRRKGI